MGLTFRHDQGVTVVEIPKELDDTHSTELGQLLDRLVAEGCRRFVIDLKGVEFIDSTGLATLVRCFQRVRSGTGSILLATLQPSVRRVFELMRLDRTFDIYPNVAAAVQHFTRS